MIKLIQQIYRIYPNPHTGFYWWTELTTNFSWIVSRQIQVKEAQKELKEIRLIRSIVPQELVIKNIPPF